MAKRGSHKNRHVRLATRESEGRGLILATAWNEAAEAVASVSVPHRCVDRYDPWRYESGR